MTIAKLTVKPVTESNWADLEALGRVAPGGGAPDGRDGRNLSGAPNDCLCISVADLNHLVGHVTLLCSNRLFDEVAWEG